MIPMVPQIPVTIYNNGSTLGFILSGGVETTVGTETVLTFSQSGTLTVTGGTGSFRMLIVGGGSGGNRLASGSGAGGGGGGGGACADEYYSIGSGSYNLIVGTGGAGKTVSNGNGAAGHASSFPGLITAPGSNGTSVSIFIGNRSGNNRISPSPSIQDPVTGGWGSGGSGNEQSGQDGGNGGAGLNSDISGTTQMYGAGGGGGGFCGTTTGCAGKAGGDVVQSNGTGGFINIATPQDGLSGLRGGGGGGGGCNAALTSNGGNGGNGCIIIRYTKIFPIP